MKSRNLVLAMVGAGLALGGLAAPAASADTHRLSANCASPSGKKINISWGDGHQTVTVYYNNHCNQARAIKLHYRNIGGLPASECFVAPKNKQGRKVVDRANPVGVSILAGGRC